MDLCCSGLAPRRFVPLYASKNASRRCFQDVMAASCRKDRNMSPSLWKVTQKQVCKWEIVQSQYIRTCKLLGVLVSCTYRETTKTFFLFFCFSPPTNPLASPPCLPPKLSNFLPVHKTTDKRQLLIFLPVHKTTEKSRWSASSYLYVRPYGTQRLPRTDILDVIHILVFTKISRQVPIFVKIGQK